MNGISYQKGLVIAEGKTKILYDVSDHPDLVIVQNKDDITKNDDPSQTKSLQSKALYATETTCNVFELLVAAGIPCAYKRQLSSMEFLADRCQMIPLEVIARRYAVGSYLCRFPHLNQDEEEPPYRFHRLVFELFLKTTGGHLASIDGRDIDLSLTYSGKTVDDPLIANHKGSIWSLRHPKIPQWQFDSKIGVGVPRKLVLPDSISIEFLEEVARRTFLVLEGAWAQLGYRMVDFKIEFGVTSDGRLVVADVIDNDSWRLRTRNWQEVSKQLFRDNVDLSMVADKYALVAGLSKHFRIPDQALVFWCTSSHDDISSLSGSMKIPGVTVLLISHQLSGFTGMENRLERLEDMIASYPEGGVILAAAGTGNDFGPILAERTSWPVIVAPLGEQSGVSVSGTAPLAFASSPSNACLLALNVFAQKNPVAYMHRQYTIG